ncbi:hypothetical protein H2198_008838 [Neophaeococcomyces mojaviensis]|uniref:Uncharacterized protein n=1 Tax=Neophaeococcomyces mojaviensis TaxID=3383035 RepID=A0ACC2ZWC7_9EURO|nr:hypothetical protein H2198_008838 [Knufia sp. JES_112]
MNADIKPQINTARHLADDVARIGALSRHRFNGRGSETDNDRSRDEVEERHSSQVGALPVSAPNSIADKLLNVYVADEKTREELSNRLQEIKSNLLDLCERQLNDLLDETSLDGTQAEVEDADKLLAEMRTVRRSMETVVALEQALGNA